MSHKVYHMAVNDVYPHYVAKAEKNWLQFTLINPMLHHIIK